jgi:peptidoglycan/xylan/chitin deacetylase (PgdA/CDA1 family)
MQIPILTYHSMRIHGNGYSSNDHVAFREDLRSLTSLGFDVVALSQIVQWLSGQDERSASGRKLVGITFDDGPDFDFRDLPHPTWGVQRSMLAIMQDFRAERRATAAPPTVHATSFVIVSPDARRELDRTCMVGRDWWKDDWWETAICTGLLAIGNHSWDHNHPSLHSTEQSNQAAGTFKVIDNFDAAEVQIAQAARWLRAKVSNTDADLFAYPYGEASDYLVREYFPLHGARIGIRAAFTCKATPVTENSNRWLLPRYVFAHDWKTPDELVKLLHDAHTS